MTSVTSRSVDERLEVARAALDLMADIADLTAAERLALAASQLACGSGRSKVLRQLAQVPPAYAGQLRRTFALQTALESGEVADFAAMDAQLPRTVAALSRGVDAKELLSIAAQELEEGAQPGLAERLLLSAVGAMAEDWGQVARWLDGRQPSERLLAAHVLADHCGDTAAALELLDEPALQSDLLVAELRLDAAFASADASLIQDALVARARSLRVNAGSTVAGRVAGLLDVLLSGAEPPARVEELGASGWSELCWLAERRRSATNRADLARVYRRMASDASGATAEAWALRYEQLVGAELAEAQVYGPRYRALGLWQRMLRAASLEQPAAVLEAGFSLAATLAGEQRVATLLVLGALAWRDETSRRLILKGTLGDQGSFAVVALRRAAGDDLSLSSLVVEGEERRVVERLDRLAERPVVADKRGRRSLTGPLKALDGGRLEQISPFEEALSSLEAYRRGAASPAVLFSQVERLLSGVGESALRLRCLELLCQYQSSPQESWLELARLHRQRGEREELLTALGGLLRAGPTDEASLAFLEEVIIEQRAPLLWAELCEQREARLAGDPEALRRLLQRRGEIELEVFDAPSAAAESYKRLLELEPTHHVALVGLEAALRAGGKLEELARLLQEQAERTDDRRQAAQLLGKAASMLNELDGATQRAERLLERAFSLDPTNPDAFEAIDRRMVRERAHRRRATLWIERAQLVDDRQARVEALVKAAEICEENGDLRRAVELYQDAREQRPRAAELLSALLRLYEALERWDDYLPVLSELLAQTTSKADRARLLFQRGSVLEVAFGDLEGAERAYQDALLADTHLQALHGLRELSARRGDWNSVLQALATEAKLWKKDEAKASVLAQIARVHAEELGDRRAAKRHYRQALSLDRNCAPARLGLFALAVEEGPEAAVEWGRACLKPGILRKAGAVEVDFYADYCGALESLGRMDELRETLAGAFDEGICDERLLWMLFRMAREARHTHKGLIESAQELCAEQPRWAGLVEAARGLEASSAGRLEEAVEALHGAQQALAGAYPVCEVLAELYVAQGDYSAAKELFEGALERTDEPVAALRWLADHELLRSAQPAAAGALLERALEVCGDEASAAEIAAQLSRIASLIGDHALGRSWAEQALRSAGRAGLPGSTTATFHHRRACCLSALGADSEAQADWERAQELAPTFLAPYVGVALSLVERGEVDGALAQLKFAEQNVEGEALASVHAFAAEVALSAGHHRKATRLARKAARVGAQDELFEGRVLVAQGQRQAAVEALRAASGGSSDVRIYETLRAQWSLLGEIDRSRCAGQVVATATGSAVEDFRREALQCSLRKGNWSTLHVGESAPLARLFALRQEAFPSAGAEVGSGGGLVDGSVQLALTLLAPQFQVQGAAHWVEQEAPLKVVDQTLLLDRRLQRFKSTELRPLLIYGLAAIKAGYQELVAADGRTLKQVAEELSMLLDEASSPQSLSRRGRREAAAIRRELGDALPSFEAWLGDTRRWLERMALLLSSDFAACCKMLALQQGIAPDVVLGAGVPFALVDGGPELARYYVSKRYEQEYALLS